MTAATRTGTPVLIEGDGLEVRVQEIGGGMTVAFIKLPKGTDMAPALKGLPDDLCQCPHWGHIVSGRLRMRTKDGEDFYEAGEAYYWSPGHAPEALEDVEVVEFSPTKEFMEVMEHIK
ncbi:hypothetical protein E4N62_17305 [Streptomyces sp. MNU76]|uniref:hypothetical protein n=1 Tax=Streptomyces sp. MNU76 TaxID=2560026 RepID=UPI001E31E711|nr:hypothetical protein [Streptomyces sp. MNU76]MCC9706870.1 hypothetical protein [Streptomyces sp. MNU76]